MPREIARKTSKTGLLVTVAGFVLLVLAAIFAYIEHRSNLETAQSVQHTFEVKERASALFGRLRDAETGQRGFLLTDDPQYLDPYEKAVERIPDLLTRFKGITRDNPEQSALADDIERIVHAKMAELANAIELRRVGSRDDVIALIKTDEGKKLMDELREKMASFMDRENQLLAKRQEQFATSSTSLRSALFGALAVAVVLGIVSFLMTKRNLAEISEKQQRLENINHELELRVAERTNELEQARIQAEDQRGIAEKERDRVELVLRDMNHRIGNNLALVSSLIGLQIGATRNSEAKRALDAARNRVQAIAVAQRRLRLGSDLESTEISNLLSSVVEDLRGTSPHGDRIKLEGRFDEFHVNSRDAITIALVVNELSINALKHAFPDNRNGRIEISLRLDENNTPVLTVADNGIGTTPSRSKKATGLGSKIIERLSQQFGAEITETVTPDGGTTRTIRLVNLEIEQPGAEVQANAVTAV